MIRRRLGFREKIVVLIAVPLAALLLAGVPLLATQAQAQRGAVADLDAMRTATTLQPLLSALAAERALTLASVALPPAPGALAAAQVRSRAAVPAVVEALADRAPARVLDALTGLRALEGVRSAARDGRVAADEVLGEFGTALRALADASGTGGADLVRTAERLAAVDAALLWAAVDPERAFDAAGVVADAAGTAEVLRSELTGRGAAAGWAVTALDTVASLPPNVQAADLAARLRSDPRGVADERAADVPRALADLTAATVPRELAVSGALNARLDAAAAAVGGATAGAVVTGAVLAAMATLVVVVGLQIGRSVSRPLRRLAQAADQVAELASVELARVSDSDDLDAPAPQLAAVRVEAPDELGTLAASFNRVQAMAALLLERQVLVRRNSAAMLGNVGQRTRSLVARQLAIIDSLERDEQAPDRLDRLYRLDHITSRLRRNADSLLTLSSAAEPDLAGGPEPVADIVRAALSSIEDFHRVQLEDLPDRLVAPQVKADLTLLLSELVENAVVFSPPGSPVTVSGTASRAGVRLEIVDRGMGMSDAELAGHNSRLLQRERLDIAPSPVLGLVVVGRTARRHGVAVGLRATPGGGTTAVVEIPQDRLVPLPQPVAAQPRAPRPAPAPHPRPPHHPALPPDPTGRHGRHGLVVPPDDALAARAMADELDRMAAIAAPGEPAAAAVNGTAGNGHARPAPLPPRSTPHLSPATTPLPVVPPTAPPAPPRAAAPPPVPPVAPTAQPAPPPGAQGLRRRVPARAVGAPERTTPLLGPTGDPDAVRALVEELQAGVARAVREARTQGPRNTEENP